MQRRAKRVSENDWENNKNVIIALYQANPLKDMVRLMEDRHGFSATPRQYTHQLKQWGIKKYIKNKEMDAVSRDSHSWDRQSSSTDSDRTAAWEESNELLCTELEMGLGSSTPQDGSSLLLGSVDFLDEKYWEKRLFATPENPICIRPTHSEPIADTGLVFEKQEPKYQMCPYMARNKKRFDKEKKCNQGFLDVANTVCHIVDHHKRLPCQNCAHQHLADLRRACPCRQSYDPEDGMTEEQGEAIAGLPLSGPQKPSWKSLYALLFPMDQTIPSPYVDPPKGPSQLTQLLKQVGMLDADTQRELINILQNQQRTRQQCQKENVHPIKLEPAAQDIKSCNISLDHSCGMPDVEMDLTQYLIGTEN